MGCFAVVLSEGVAQFLPSVHSPWGVTRSSVEASLCVRGSEVASVSGWVACVCSSRMIFFSSDQIISSSCPERRQVVSVCLLCVSLLALCRRFISYKACFIAFFMPGHLAWLSLTSSLPLYVVSR